MSKYSDTIYALSTPPGKSAIAVIRVSGKKVIKIFKQITKKSKITPNKTNLVFLKNKDALIDQALVIYFKSPTEVKLLKELTEKKIRIGGMVKKNSIKTTFNKLNFIITDFKNEINVSYSGAVPNLFEEEKGVVAEGFLKDRNFFIAKKILAKHDENYMPPEVKKALEQN